MRRRLIALPWIPALLLLGTTPAPRFVEQPHGGIIVEQPRPGIDIEAYRFELTLRDDIDRITGRATVRFRFTADGVAELPLDLIGVRRPGDGGHRRPGIGACP